MKTKAKEYFSDRFKEPVLSIKSDGFEGVWKFFKVIGPKTTAIIATKPTQGIKDCIETVLWETL
jgi:hypothetical protein